MTFLLTLADSEATLHLGRMLAASLPDAPPYAALLLEGDLGAGKTTLVRGMVESMPGGDEAEVASPSFTLQHVYPTNPECVHMDIYRLEGMEPDAALCESLNAGHEFVVVEWAQFLPAHCRPDNFVRLVWQPTSDGRVVSLTAEGPVALQWLTDLQDHMARS